MGRARTEFPGAELGVLTVDQRAMLGDTILSECSTPPQTRLAHKPPPAPLREHRLAWRMDGPLPDLVPAPASAPAASSTAAGHLASQRVLRPRLSNWEPASRTRSSLLSHSVSHDSLAECSG